MVAVADRPTAAPPLPVTVVAGEAASGLASMVGQYLEQLLADSPEKRAEAAALRGRLGLLAREGAVGVTIVFAEDGIAIEEGLHQPDAVVSGQIDALMNVLSGRAHPAFELCRGQIAVRPTLRRPLFGHQAYRLMRLPGARPWSGVPPAVVAVTAGAVVVLGALALARHRQQRREGNDA